MQIAFIVVCCYMKSMLFNVMEILQMLILVSFQIFSSPQMFASPIEVDFAKHRNNQFNVLLCCVQDSDWAKIAFSRTVKVSNF